MSLPRALLYFIREAAASLLRSWRIAIVAVLTMAVSLFLCGLFLVAFQNLSAALEEWRSGLRVTVYLRDEVPSEQVDALQQTLREPSWVLGSERVDADEAEQRFREAFPSLAELTEGWDDAPLPASLEASLEPDQIDSDAFEDWLERLESEPAALMVDADQEWLGQLATLLRLFSGASLTLGVVFLAAAALTAASLLRLVAHLHRDEIAIMRLVGATEFFIRGPFYVEGLIQGLVAAVLAWLSLVSLIGLAQRQAGTALWSALVFGEYLSLRGSLLLLAAGVLTGSLGAVLSLRRDDGDVDLGP